MISKLTAIIMAIVSLVSNLAGVIPSSLVYYKDVAYGTQERQIMDVCFPENPSESEGVVVFIHGGGWLSGDKSVFEGRARNVSKTVGCISATINYRYISKTVHCTDILKDIDSALTKIRSMAETRGIDCNKVMLVGVSAGAQLAMLYSYAKKNTAPIEPCAVVSYSGPTDLRSETFINNNSLWTPAQTRTVLSYLTGEAITASNIKEKKNVLYKFSPLKYVSYDSVPTLVVHGVKDTIVPVADVRAFVKNLAEKNVTYKYIEMPDSGHSLDNDSYILSKSDEVFVDFVNMFLK